jgi:transcriptional/translational regulatory protein YebC/TACO1
VSRRLDFYAPVSTNEVVTFKAGLNHVGSSSLEIGVKVLAEAPMTGEVRHACTAYLTFVHLGPDMRPQPCRPFVPETPVERRRWHEALERRERRLERVKQIRTTMNKGGEGIMSGHSRWSQIKRKKGKTDVPAGEALLEDPPRDHGGGAQRRRRSQGQPPAQGGRRIRQGRQYARGQHQARGQKGTGELPGEQYEEITYEGYGSGGVAVLVQVLTDNKNRTGPELRHIFEKNSGHMGTSGCVAWMFERRGLIQADAMRIKEDELLEKALDAGAADVKQVDNAFEIATAPDEMETVRQGLERAGFRCSRPRSTWCPNPPCGSTARTPRRCCG